MAFKMEMVKIDDLKFADYNPRKLGHKDKLELKKSIEKFGVVSPAVVNNNPERFNIIIGGHQRVKVCRELGHTEFPVIYLNLELEKEKELNIRLNKNQGEFDPNSLHSFFKKEELIDFGFTEKELGFFQDEYQQALGEYNDDNCEMPIVQQYNEKYDIFVIMSKTEVDSMWFKNNFGLSVMRSYKNKAKGQSFVIPMETIMKKWADKDK